jgi:type IV pilus assembly protein PilE
MKQIRAKLKTQLPAMTLIELLLVLALIGILLSLAVPKLLPLISRTKSLEAQMQLKHLLNLQKNYYYINSKYGADLSSIGFEQEKLVSEDGKANYRIEIIEASASGFLARASSITDFDQDGQLNVWQINEQEKIDEIVGD